MTDRSASELFEQLLQLTCLLRSPEGCAWDRAQTIDSIRPHFVEEFHEVLEALDLHDDEKLQDELGDLLYLLTFIATVAEESNRFCMSDIISGIDAKLRRRHPHVFGDVVASTPDEVRQTWETIKLEERTHKGRRSLLDGLPAELSALLTARRIQEKAASVGFDWSDPSDVLDKIEEELKELRAEIDDGRVDLQENELGDLLFAVVNVARFQEIDPEAALRRTNLKFRRRFAAIEEAFKGRDLRDVGLEAMDRVWNESKIGEDASGEADDQSEES